MKYEFITVTYENNKLAGAELLAHRETIAACAAKGWRYVGYIPTKLGPSGKTLELDLVFETES